MSRDDRYQFGYVGWIEHPSGISGSDCNALARCARPLQPTYASVFLIELEWPLGSRNVEQRAVVTRDGIVTDGNLCESGNPLGIDPSAGSRQSHLASKIRVERGELGLDESWPTDQVHVTQRPDIARHPRYQQGQVPRNRRGESASGEVRKPGIHQDQYYRLSRTPQLPCHFVGDNL